ncbi:MAG TPA: IPT/TIG domain-containing protein [Candidatus Paceibacterota bacterium]
MLVQKLSLLVLLLQQLVTQLGQAQPMTSDLGRQASNGSLASNEQVSVPVPKPPKPEAPVITRVEPAAGGVETRVTLYGFGFDRERNIVYTGAGEVVASSPDGKTLSFVLPRPPFLTNDWLTATAAYRRERYGETPIKFPLGFYVKNSNGLTEKPALFSLTF